MDEFGWHSGCQTRSGSLRVRPGGCQGKSPLVTIVQRVTEAEVTVAGEIVGRIGPGLLALVAITGDDKSQDVEWMASKLVSLRIFRNGEKHFDRDVREIGGSILLVSNFTVSADARKGRRPSFDRAAQPAAAQTLFDSLVAAVAANGVTVATGRFGADMLISLTNDGPATFVLENSKQDS
jgi:D-tyrosyl-tRNA(Tyr) deacylase